MAKIYPSVPVAGQPDSTEEPKIITALETILAEFNGNIDTTNLDAAAGITGAQLAASAAIADTQLASPNNATWKTISELRGYATDSAVTGANWFLLSDGGGAVANGGAIPITPPGFVPITAADLAVAGKTTQVRLKAIVGAGGANPGATCTFHIASFSLSASNWVMGTSTGVQVAVIPAANSVVPGTGTAVSLPSDGSYMFVMASSGAFAAGTGIWFHLQLQAKHA